MTILIVDDLEHQREALKAAVKQVVPDCEFIEADNLDSAISIIKGDKPIDLAVVDIRLPDGEEGLEVVELINEQTHRKDMRSILITAYPKDKSDAMVSRVGADGFISKLNSGLTTELQGMIRKLLEIKGILIVDDREDQREIIKVAIETVVPRCKFIYADNLEVAKAIVKGTRPIDLAVVDIKLSPGGKEGLEVITTIRSQDHRKDLRTVLVTAPPAKVSNSISKKVGADGFISKLDKSATRKFQDMVKKLLNI